MIHVVGRGALTVGEILQVYRTKRKNVHNAMALKQGDVNRSGKVREVELVWEDFNKHRHGITKKACHATCGGFTAVSRESRGTR